MSIPPFTPIATGTLAVTETNARILLPGTYQSGQRRIARVMNSGNSVAFIEFGNSSVSATAGGDTSASPDGSMPLLPGVVEVFTVLHGHTHLAGICQAGATSVVRVTMGEGE